MNGLEQALQHDWSDGRSSGAAAREFCRTLGVSGQFPMLRRLLEERLATEVIDAPGSTTADAAAALANAGNGTGNGQALAA